MYSWNKSKKWAWTTVCNAQRRWHSHYAFNWESDREIGFRGSILELVRYLSYLISWRLFPFFQVWVRKGHVIMISHIINIHIIYNKLPTRPQYLRLRIAGHGHLTTVCWNLPQGIRLQSRLTLFLRGGSTSSLSHFLEFYGAASVAPMGFSIVLSLLLRRGSTSSLSHFLELYGAASVAPMWFSIVLSLLLRGGWIPTLHLKFFWGLTCENDKSKAPGVPQSWYLWPGAFLSLICHTVP